MQYDARYIQRHINKLQYDGTVHTTSINTLPNVVRYTERQISWSGCIELEIAEQLILLRTSDYGR